MSIQVSGFTFVRNAVQLDYPVVESIRSILPLVDEFVVNVGPSPDGTLELIRSIGDSKIRILESEWHPHTSRGGFVYAQQTNVALFNCRGKWAFYVQADEVVHEGGLPALEAAMRRYADDPKVDGLALEQIDLWGDYRTKLVRSRYKARRCRVVKPHHFVLSRGDAAGFTVHPKYKERGRYPRVAETPATLFHYCRLKALSALESKRRVEAAVWGERAFAMELDDDMIYESVPRAFVDRYEGTHPAVMTERMQAYPYHVDLASPRWRTRLTAAERLELWRWQLGELTAGRTVRRAAYRKVA